MDCTGLTYQKVRSNVPSTNAGRPVDAGNSRNGDYRSAGRNIDDDDNGGGDDDENYHHRGVAKSSFHTLPYTTQYMLVLEPAIHQLVEYTDCEELNNNRHVVMSQELRQLINAELRKYSIVTKVNEGGCGATDGSRFSLLLLYVVSSTHMVTHLRYSYLLTHYTSMLMTSG